MPQLAWAPWEAPGGTGTYGKLRVLHKPCLGLAGPSWLQLVSLAIISPLHGVGIWGDLQEAHPPLQGKFTRKKRTRKSVSSRALHAKAPPWALMCAYTVLPAHLQVPFPVLTHHPGSSSSQGLEIYYNLAQNGKWLFAHFLDLTGLSYGPRAISQGRWPYPTPKAPLSRSTTRLVSP